MTICLNCRKLTHTAPGFCSVCGEVFADPTIARQVASKERDSESVIITLKYPTFKITLASLPMCKLSQPQLLQELAA